MKNKKRKIVNVVVIVIIIVCIFNIINSLYHIFIWKQEGDEIKHQVEELVDIGKPTEVVEDSNDKIEVIEQEEKIEEVNPYWEYMKMSLISVDFADLKEANRDTVGWIQVNGTNINYPFVQTENNTYYLTHAFDKSYNSAGWVFLDYRNNKNLTDKNNILYAHGRLDSTMFGSLRNALTNGWLDNKNNYVFKTSTEKENSIWQVFSVYRIPVTSDYLRISFTNDDDFLNFANMLKDRSEHKFDTSISKNDKILTLSTCYDDKLRVVLHAKLIKKENR